MRLGELARELGGDTHPACDRSGIERGRASPARNNPFKNAWAGRVRLRSRRRNPTNHQVETGVQFARPLNIDLIVSVGGGSAMDCAKGINFLLTNGGVMRDYKGFGKAHKPMLASIGVPTTAGTGSKPSPTP